MTKADRIEEAILVVQTIEAIDKRLADINNGVVPAYFGDPLPKTVEQLGQFLTGTRWLSAGGTYLEILPDGACRQSTMSPVVPWRALSSTEAVRQGANPEIS